MVLRHRTWKPAAGARPALEPWHTGGMTSHALDDEDWRDSQRALLVARAKKRNEAAREQHLADKQGVLDG